MANGIYLVPRLDGSVCVRVDDDNTSALRAVIFPSVDTPYGGGRGLHSSTSQLNLSRSCNKNTPRPPLDPLTNPKHPLNNP